MEQLEVSWITYITCRLELDKTYFWKLETKQLVLKRAHCWMICWISYVVSISTVTEPVESYRRVSICF